MGKPDMDSHLRLRKLEGADGASLAIHKKHMALQKPKKDPLESLHQCGTCCVSEACPTLLGSCTLGPCSSLPPSSASPLTPLTPVPLAIREVAATLRRPGRLLQPEPSLGS